MTAKSNIAPSSDIYILKTKPLLALNKQFIYKVEQILSEIIDIFSLKSSKVAQECLFSSSISEMFRTESNHHYEVIDFLVKINKFLSDYNEDYSIMALILLDKFLKLNPSFILSRDNLLNIILICFSLAMKVNSDEFVSNVKLSFISGVGLEEIMNMELNFLTMINYDCFISVERFNKYKISFSKREVY